MTGWVTVCPLDEIEPEDVRRFDHDGQTYAIARDEHGNVFAVEGLCTHEKVHLADGFVFGDVLECPRHQGRFRLGSGLACGGPVHDALKTFAIRIEDDTVFMQPDPAAP